MIGAAIGSSLIGAASANKAAKAQKQAADAQLALQERVYEENVARFQPYVGAGKNYLAVQQYLDGVGGKPMIDGAEYGGFQATPGYQFAVDQGVGAIDAGAAAKGGLYSGKTMQDLNTFGQGMANQEFGNYYNRIAGGAGAGQAAAGQQAQAGQNYATGGSNALANYGNAAAAGAIGVGNALQGGIGNAMGLYQYQNNLNRPQAANGRPGMGIW